MTNTNITETELEEISDDTFTKKSISWILKKRESKNSDSPPLEEKTKENLIPTVRSSIKKTNDIQKEYKEIEINKKDPLKKEVNLTTKEDIPKKTFTTKDSIPDKKENKVVLTSIKKEILTDDERKEKSNKEIIIWGQKLLTKNESILNN